MKPIETTKRDRFGYGRTFAIRHDEACGKASLAETRDADGYRAGSRRLGEASKVSR